MLDFQLGLRRNCKEGRNRGRSGKTRDGRPADDRAQKTIMKLRERMLLRAIRCLTHCKGPPFAFSMSYLPRNDCNFDIYIKISPTLWHIIRLPSNDLRRFYISTTQAECFIRPSSSSETVGRRSIYYYLSSCFSYFNILGAVSTNIAMLMVMRLLSLPLRGTETVAKSEPPHNILDVFITGGQRRLLEAVSNTGLRRCPHTDPDPCICLYHTTSFSDSGCLAWRIISYIISHLAMDGCMNAVASRSSFLMVQYISAITA